MRRERDNKLSEISMKTKQVKLNVYLNDIENGLLIIRIGK